MNTTVSVNPIPAMIDSRGLSAALGVSESTIERWRSQGTVRLPYVRIGPRKIMYRASDVAKFLEGQVIE
jgi:hypothetical protein